MAEKSKNGIIKYEMDETMALKNFTRRQWKRGFRHANFLQLGY